MQRSGGITGASMIAELDGANASVGASQLRLLEVITECERSELWTSDGCRDLAQWLSGRLGISNWTARRWIHAAQSFPSCRAFAQRWRTGCCRSTRS
jgi:hypothetical protein